MDNSVSDRRRQQYRIVSHLQWMLQTMVTAIRNASSKVCAGPTKEKNESTQKSKTITSYNLYKQSIFFFNMSTIKVQPIRSSWSPPSFTQTRVGNEAHETPIGFETQEEMVYLSLLVASLISFVLTFV